MQVLEDCTASGDLCDQTLGCVTPVRDACEVARATRSYLGCEYRASSVLNPTVVLRSDGFSFGVVLANAGELEASVQIARGGAAPILATVAAHDAVTISLPWIDELVANGYGSQLVDDGSYRIVSSQPIAAYQYNPLEFRRDVNCRIDNIDTVDLSCFSFSNDASLLLPESALGTEYMIDTIAGQGGGLGAFATVIATSDTVVRILPHATIDASSDGRIPMMTPGQWHDVPVTAGAALQLVSASGDLSGTEIQAAASLLVIAGHGCANVPSTSRACDHLEEIVPPLHAWGTDVVAAMPRSVPGEPSILRILSSADENSISVSTLGSTFNLDRGEHFDIVTTDDVHVVATRPILLSQYLVGALFFNRAAPGSHGPMVGDPAMGFVVPTAQYRHDYVFVAPPTYDRSTVSIVAHVNDTVSLDDQIVDAWQVMPAGDYQIARIEVFPGAHRIASGEGVGVTMYAVAPFTSYLLPAGLNVEFLQ